MRNWRLNLSYTGNLLGRGCWMLISITETAPSAAPQGNCISAGFSMARQFRTCGSIRRDGSAATGRQKDGTPAARPSAGMTPPSTHGTLPWFDPNRPIETHPIGRAVGAGIVQIGEDHNGLLNRWRFVEIMERSFIRLGEGSWDKGSTWTLLMEMRARKVAVVAAVGVQRPGSSCGASAVAGNRPFDCLVKTASEPAFRQACRCGGVLRDAFRSTTGTLLNVDAAEYRRRDVDGTNRRPHR